jgi:putative hydrolase of the HAD superfamily
MRYPFVLLDAGETLFGPRESFGATYARVLGAMGIRRSAEVFEEAMRHTWREMDRTIPAGTDRYGHFAGGENAYWLRFARRTIERASGEAIPVELAAHALEGLRAAFRGPSAWRVFPDTVPALEVLREAGVRTGVVSNWDSRLPRLLDTLGLSRYFDAITVSHLEGVEKPSPALFHRALEKLGAHPGDALHVGDVPELDLAGAQAAGVDAVLVDRRGRFGASLPTIPDLSHLPLLAHNGLEFR